MALHPAPYPRYILSELASYLRAYSRSVGRKLTVLDPMAGIGRVHDLPRDVVAETVGVELEPEWARARKGTVVGDATKLPRAWAARFDAVVVSPVYGNRLSDHHEAKDSCPACKGVGVEWTTAGCGDAPMLCPQCHDVACKCGGYALAQKHHVAGCRECSRRKCKACGGRGISVRHTYRHALGRPLSDNNAGQMQWPAAAYRDLHEAAWREAFRVVAPGGIILCNVKNHIRQGAEQFVVEWHEQALAASGFRVLAVVPVAAPGIRHGQNHGARVANEQIIVGRRLAS